MTQHLWGGGAGRSEAGDGSQRVAAWHSRPRPSHPPAAGCRGGRVATHVHPRESARACWLGSCAGTAFSPRGGPGATGAAGSWEEGLRRDLRERHRGPLGGWGAALRWGPLAGWASPVDSGARVGVGGAPGLPEGLRGEVAGSLMEQEAEGRSYPRRTLPGAWVPPCPAQQGPSVQSSPQPSAWGVHPIPARLS